MSPLTRQAEAGLVEVPHASVTGDWPSGSVCQRTSCLFLPSMRHHGYISLIRGAVYALQAQNLNKGRENIFCKSWNTVYIPSMDDHTILWFTCHADLTTQKYGGERVEATVGNLVSGEVRI